MSISQIRHAGFSYALTDVKINNDGSISYFGMLETIISAVKKNINDTVYDQYYSRSFFVKNEIAYELGYNTGVVKYNDRGDMLYSGIADLQKKEYLLMLNYGESRIILNKKKFDEIYDYGFTPAKEIYYVGQNYDNLDLNKNNSTYLYIGDKQIGNYDYITFQGGGNNYSILKFDSKNNYAFVAEQRIDSNTFESFIVTNSGRLPFPKNVSGVKMFSYISSLIYSKDDKLFFIGDMILVKETYKVTKEIFVDNKSLGKIYNTIGEVKYDKSINEITFIASRENKIYFVTVSL